ncbi:ATP-binding cassette domain-containing protein [Paenibacillus sp. LC-T2]|uniref:ABC transporter ATP-binding protein n=2 Tax=Paenibacillus monticola TaxID=2666075 RepID=A0A7X2L3F7_9BACL|nr:ATP-binding cassette domain-containing protein [Paenibacillus monticola]
MHKEYEEHKEHCLVFEEVVYRYPDTVLPALQGLSVAIPKGYRTAVLGHNGSGKSTMFLQAVGILRPQSGEVIRAGAELSYAKKDLADLRRSVGLVFQDPEQQLILNTPLEDVSFGLRNAGMDEQTIKQRCHEVLEQLDLTSFSDKPIHQLSLGQKKRTALAGVMAMKPELLLLDEPTSYLDPLSETLLLEGLETIYQQGTTIVMATHDMNLAYRWADWVIVLEAGRCFAAGTPADIFAEREALQAIGLELPLLADLWQSLPPRLTAGQTAPRNAGDFKDMLSLLLKEDMS